MLLTRELVAYNRNSCILAGENPNESIQPFLRMAFRMTKSTKPEDQGKGKDAFSDFASFSDQTPKQPQTVKDSEIAGYIAEMLIPLRHLAIEADTEFLSYLIEMAIEEAMLQSDKKN